MFKPSRFDHDYALCVLNKLTSEERAALDAHVVRLNKVAVAWSCNDPAEVSRKAFENSYYAIARVLRERGESYPAL